MEKVLPDNPKGPNTTGPKPASIKELPLRGESPQNNKNRREALVQQSLGLSEAEPGDNLNRVRGLLPR